MDRRRLLKLLGLPGLVALSGAAYATAARSQNRYYHGPPSDHFDGVRFFNPGSKDRGLRVPALAAGGRIGPRAIRAPFATGRRSASPGFVWRSSDMRAC
jgi:hypothetical protein